MFTRILKKLAKKIQNRNGHCSSGGKGGGGGHCS